MKTNLCKRLTSASLSALLALSAFASAGVTAGAYSGEMDSNWQITIGDVNKKYRDTYDLFTKINAKRQEAGLTPLTLVTDWCDDAFVRAAELPIMQATTALNDDVYDYRADDSTAIGTYYREAIAVGDLTNDEIVTQLFTDQSYSYSMTSTLAKEIGVGVVTVNDDPDTKFVCVRLTDEKTHAGLSLNEVSASTYDVDDVLTTVSTLADARNLRFEDPYQDGYTMYVGYPERIEFKATERSGKGTYGTILPNISLRSTQSAYATKDGNVITPLAAIDQLQVIVRLYGATNNDDSYGGIRKLKIVEGTPPEEEELDDLNIKPIPDQRYTGQAITPVIEVFDKNRTTLSMGIEYTASFTNNVNVGVANVQVTGLGAYAGKTASATFNIVEMPDPLELTVTLSDSAPVTGQNVTINAAVTGGTAPFKYTYEYKKTGDAAFSMIAFESASATATFSSETVGEYVLQVTVSDSGTQTVTKTANVSVTEPLTLTASATPDHLFAGELVRVSAAASGGKEPYTYSFRHSTSETAYYTGVMDHYDLHPQTNGSVTDIVTVTDANGKTAQDETTYVIGSALALTTSLSESRIDLGSKVTVTAQASGGFAPYTYTYKAGLTTAALTTLAENVTDTSVKLIPTASGTYRVDVTATDAEGYTTTNSEYLTVLEPMTVTLEADKEVVTLNDSVTFTGSVEGGTAPYSYSFTYYEMEGLSVVSKTVTTSTPTITLTPYDVGDYPVTFTVVDQNGSTKSATVTVTVSNAITGEMTISPEICAKGAEVTATVDAVGGIGDKTYTFSVRAQGTTAYTMVQSSENVSAVLPTTVVGTFEVLVKVTDQSNMKLELTGTYTVVEPIAIKNASLSHPYSYYYGLENACFVGNQVEVYAEVEGGSGTYTAELSQGETVLAEGAVTGGRVSLTFTPAEAGNLTPTLTITDSYGLTQSTGFTLTVLPKLTNSSTIEADYPYVGETVTLNALASGGFLPAGENYSYSYFVRLPGEEDFTAIDPAENTPEVSGYLWSEVTSADYELTQTGTYVFKVIVKDKLNQEEVIFPVEVTEAPALTYSVRISDKTPIVGSTVNVHVTASGGVGTLTTQVMYRRTEIAKAWNHLEVTKTSTDEVASFVPGLPVEYEVKVVVSDERGHELKKYYTVTAQAAPVLVNTSEVSAEAVMIGETVTITGKAEGGRGRYTFAYSYKKASSHFWSAVPTVSEDTATASFVARAAETYYIRIQVTDENGRSKTIVRSVTVSDWPELVNTTSLTEEVPEKGLPYEIIPTAEGGKGDITFKVFYKKITSSYWQEIEPEEGRYFFTPGSNNVTYEVKVIAKDSRGKTAVKIMDVSVGEDASQAVR